MKLYLSLLAFFTLFSLCITPSCSLTPDGEALLELKSGFNDSKGFLRSWKHKDHNPCGWLGVTCHFPDLRVRSINLPYMQLSGFISPSIGKLQRLHRLALHRNSLHGPIPPEIKNCSELRAIYLRANYLHGSIPAELGELVHLTILDLSSNLLRGTIPPSIGRLVNLRFLNLSTNFFSGEIPNVGVLNTFRNTSFVGNLELCGLPIQKLCRGSLGFPAVLPHSDNVASQGFESAGVPPMQTRRTPHFLNGVLIGAMSTLGLALVAILGFLWICLLSRKGNLSEKYVKVDKQHVPNIGTKLVTFHGDIPYSSEEIIKKLEQLDEEDVVGSGGFGTVYKMVMDDSSIFAVKRIDRNREGSDQIFETELEILGSIKHINLVNLRGYCRLPTAKLLIYDYLALGSLDHYLHDHGEDEQQLNWNARMKIALGSARGLAYLHHDCSPVIIHRDIKSSNILLDRSLDPHVSDFGLAKLLVDDDANVTTVVAGTFGYLAPEYLNDGHATEKSDVYSFGVLLLELVTGKRPTDPCFVRRGLNVVGWLNTLNEGDRLEEIIDEKCGNVDAEAVEAVLDIAAMCTDANPDERPTMNRVLQMLEDEFMSPRSRDFYESHHLDII
ncbi:LRR receptor-like serine/threonine-protein kinase FEI 1 isoform X1 [Dioscorea cayenensis subsp. rotundata]|uniref:LRR receptor-like serine/threonine-protein kinase FEI 1 isoform X1 n=1 Tax=Dioscorea cayennensis subsp. rotundata TaxID=55577 RepID=A0AB40CL09_DIOCR|nr:LRR receptor-like serine/threonine-protein kinase FEI 1 isoform X1 [Dioscorea cayenensis subsp. rotundata]